MYTRYKNPLGYSVCTYVCDTEDDLNSCPTSTAAAGSIALIIATSKVYKLNHKKKWVEQSSSSGSGGGSSGGGGDDLDPTKHYIWDGGVVQ